MAVLTPRDAETFERCMAVEGVAVFPADTVYGLACEPESKEGARRLNALKRRRPGQAAAVLFFQPSLALAALPELGPRTRDALLALLPGPVTLLLPNPAARYPIACGADSSVLGLRVPRLPPALAALETVKWPVMQSSANLTGQPEAHRLEDVDPGIREGADLLLDGGELPGVASTIVDLTAYEAAGTWTVVREGALPAAAVAALL
ncbi:MAG: L-threonylcarbamoyladenylate synthase [Solirubrobacterales bacterium]|nr:L-threonylcarbamoyladenylate synthase [Solirubrobacterales bacterium]